MQSNTELGVGNKQLADAVRRRLQFHNIFRETALVTNMNRTIGVELKCFRKMDILVGRPEEDIEMILRTIPFLRVDPTGGGREGKTVHFEYKFSPGTLIVTGIYEQPLQRLLYSYQQTLKRSRHTEKCKQASARKIVHNGFFTLIEANSKENADNLKGYLRNRKKQMEDRTSAQFKVQNRRVRIFSVGEEDLFTFIVDIMCEYKADKFTKWMDSDLTGMRRPPITAGSTNYRVFSAMVIPTNRARPRQEEREAEVETRTRREECKKEEDVLSEQTCFTSENNFDKLQDVVEGEPFFLEGEGKDE